MDRIRKPTGAHDLLPDALEKLSLVKLPDDDKGRLKDDLEGSPSHVEGSTTIVEETLPRTKEKKNFISAVERLKPRAHKINILHFYTISDLQRVWYAADRLGVLRLEYSLQRIIERLETEHPIVKGYPFSKLEGIARPSDIQGWDNEKIAVLFDRIYGMVAYILRERSKEPNEWFSRSIPC